MVVLYCVGFFTDATCVVVVLKKNYGWCVVWLEIS
jgi:NADH:ubiquinone oxidoreductase subunit 6 (subunit J)